MRLFKDRANGPGDAKPTPRRLRHVGRIRADDYEAAAGDPGVRALIARSARKAEGRPSEDS
jgi:hypothetical protein